MTGAAPHRLPWSVAQLCLDFGPLQGCALDAFAPGANAEALQRLRLTAPAGAGALFLAGPAASGKSHLLLGVCQLAQAEGREAVYAPLRDLRDAGAGVLDGLAGHGVVGVDDIDAVLGVAAWERALFRLWNDCESAGGLFVAASRHAPLALQPALADLASRLRAALLLPVQTPDDRTRRCAMQHLARARGYELSDEVADYLLWRLPRDMHTLARVVIELDQGALSRQRRVTLPFARQWLAEHGAQGR